MFQGKYYCSAPNAISDTITILSIRTRYITWNYVHMVDSKNVELVLLGVFVYNPWKRDWFVVASKSTAEVIVRASLFGYCY